MGLSISVCFSPLSLFALISLLLDQNTETQSSSRQTVFFFFIIYRDTGSPRTQEERIPRLRGVSFVDAINLHACTFYRYFLVLIITVTSNNSVTELLTGRNKFLKMHSPVSDNQFVQHLAKSCSELFALTIGFNLATASICSLSTMPMHWRIISCQRCYALLWKNSVFKLRYSPGVTAQYIYQQKPV